MQGEERLGVKRAGGESEEAPTTYEEIKAEPEFLKMIFESIYNGAIVTDTEGRVLYFNKPYGEFLGVDAASQIGKHVTEVVENSRMQTVAQTGKAEINWVHRVKGQDMVVQRIPITRDGRVIAVYGQVMFKDVGDVSKLAKKLCLLESKVKLYEQELMSLRSTRYTLDSIVGIGRAITGLKREVMKAGATDYPVLLTGESGTGKEMFAQAIHGGSRHRISPFISINCATIPKDLLESELFGYEKGAFTNANPCGKIGKLELAHTGTVFLDEVGDLPFDMQPKLLRVLEEKTFERVGGTAPVNSDFRVIAASNQNLEEMVSAGRFRKDLFYRLNVIRLHIPPLRERKEDILPIAHHLLGQMGGNSPFSSIRIDKQAEDALVGYDWPGNVRELYNVLSRATCFLEKDAITIYDLPFSMRYGKNVPSDSINYSLDNVLSCAERESICKALEKAGNNKTKAAALLGIDRSLLYRKMKRLGVAP
jgi:PAS domain S-box-containing protein